jgi:hypothetical protein
MDAFLNARALELGDRAEDAGDKSPSGGARVDSFTERHESHASRLPLVEKHNEVPQIPPQPIQAPADDGLNLVAAHGLSQLIQGGTAVLRTTDPVVDVLDGRPASGFDIPPEFEELVLSSLFVRTDACVNGDFHRHLLSPQVATSALAGCS